jgi:Cu2+-exporting ATPase
MSIAESTDARPRAVGFACAHCGLDVPPGLVDEGAERQFCCHGCRAVYAVIHEHGLDRYYAFRAEADGEPQPASPTGRSYAELDDPGFQARACWTTPDGLAATELYLEGVHCAACVWLVERLPSLVPGLVEVRLDLPRSRALVRWDARAVALSAAARQLDALGYRAHPSRGLEAQALRRREDRRMLARIGLAGAAAANVMAIAFALYGGFFYGMEPEYASLFRWASLVVTVPAMIWGGGVFFRGAWTALRVHALHMDLPISVGLLAGFVHGTVNTVRGTGDVYFDSVTALIFLLLAGRYVQRRQQRVAADSAELLASLAPSAARLIDRGEVREVPIEALLPGSRVEVRAGDTVPADGVIAAGHSALDLSLLSGESRPTDAGPGDRVHAGTVNLSSRLEVMVECIGEDTRVGRLAKLVEEYGRRRAPIALLADRIAGHFVAAVLVLAALTFALWARVDVGRAVDHAVALLIVTCPCALALATPLALSAAIGQAARAGFLIKGADVLEKLTRPGRMWLDKTGTLTQGRAALLDWWGDPAARTLAAAAEAHSSHPLARALVVAVGAAPDVPVAIVETHGGGIEGTVAGRAVVLGSPAFVRARVGTIPPDFERRALELPADGLTPVLVAVDGTVVGAAGFGDPLREDASAALARVRRRGWRVGILSGDDPVVVGSIGRRLGLGPEDCRGGVSPEGKLRAVEGESAGSVVMVGDGVNDAAALAGATVGIAVHGGAEAALAAADVFIARPGIARVADLLDGAGRAMRTVRRNLVLSLCYNAAGAALAMAGLINPVVAAVLMPLSSITVIAHSYRARSFARPEPPPCR